MNAEQFVDGLYRAAPPKGRLESLGLSADEALRLYRSFLFVPEPSATVDDRNELTRLVTKWNATNVRIGGIQFHHPIAIDGHIRIGRVEVDPLLIAPEGELIVEEDGAPGHVLWKAAATPERLLDALLPAATFLSRCAVDSALYEDLELTKKQAGECSTLAGGPRYHDFYRMLLGG